MVLTNNRTTLRRLEEAHGKPIDVLLAECDESYGIEQLAADLDPPLPWLNPPLVDSGDLLNFLFDCHPDPVNLSVYSTHKQTRTTYDFTPYAVTVSQRVATAVQTLVRQGYAVTDGETVRLSDSAAADLTTAPPHAPAGWTFTHTHPMTHETPSVPRVAIIGSRQKPYQLASLAAYVVAYATPAFVQVRQGDSVRGYGVSSVLCLPTEAHWQQLLRQHQALAESLQALADVLKGCGRYPDVLAAGGAFDNQPRRLCQTVIAAPYPEETWFELNPKPLVWTIPTVVRVTLSRHTPKKLVYETGERLFQTGHYCCSGDDEWQTVLDQANLCDRLHHTLNATLTTLGTYQQARDDHRWQDKAIKLFT